MSERIKKSTLVAVCGMSTALSVALLFTGSIAYILAYTLPMIIGIYNRALVKTFGRPAAWITFTATGLLSLILVFDKESAIMYITCFGYYPIIQDSLNKIQNAVLRIISKLLIFNVVLALGQLALVYIFGIPFLEEGEGKIFIYIFIVAMNFLFFLYDKLLIKLLFIYEKLIERHVKRIFK